MYRRFNQVVSLLIVLSVIMSFIFNAFSISAANEVSNVLVSDLVSQSGVRVDDTDNEYEITLSVPGKDSKGYNEIIFMIDSSKSMLSQMNNFIAAIREMRDSILNSNEKIRFTLMHFGIAGGTIFSVDTKEEFIEEAEKLSYQLMRRWPTATNCEAGFVHIQEHISNSPNLNKALVVYITDGGVNCSEYPLQFYTWRDNPSWQVTNILTGTFKTYFKDVQCLSDTTIEMFPEVFEDLPSGFDIRDTTINSQVGAAMLAAVNADPERANAWLDRIWDEAYEFAGLDPDESYPISTVEKAFIAAHGMESAAHFAFAIAILNGVIIDSANRAKLAGEALALMPQVEELCMVDLGTQTWIDNLDNAHENVTVVNGSTTNYVSKIIEYSNSVVAMPINDPVITSPISKWADFVPDSVSVYEDDVEIWNQTQGWLITENKPVAEGDPVTITQDPTTGKHTIEWNIKEGALLLSDNYSLKYNVTVDTEAENFRYNTDYPANNTTYIDYVNESGVSQREGILISDIYAPGESSEETDDVKLILHKYTNTETDVEGDGKEVDPEVLDGRDPIEGVYFDIYLVGTTYQLDNEYVPWSLKPTAEEIALYQTAERLVATICTDETGVAEFDLLKYEQEQGLYLVVERKADFIERAAEPFYVLLPMHDPADLSIIMNEVHVYPKNDLVELDGPDGVINIEKTDNTEDKNPLAGAEFKIGRAPAEGEVAEDIVVINNKEIEVVWVQFYPNRECTGDMVYSVTTDAEGKAIMAGLMYGTYYIKEIKAPENYIMLTEAKVAQVSKYATSKEVVVSFENIKGEPLLPTTGSLGTTIFTICGLMLTIISGTVILMVHRVRKAKRAFGDSSIDDYRIEEY